MMAVFLTMLEIIIQMQTIFPNISNQSITANRTLDAFVSGPVIPSLGDKLTFNVSVRNNKSDGYLYGVREHRPSDFAYFPPSGDGTYKCQAIVAMFP